MTDGLTGNIALKLMEGVSQTLLGAVRDAAMASTRAKLGGALLRPALREVRDEIDPEAAGRRVPAGAAKPRRGPARALHAEGLRAGDPARAARRREDLVGQTQLALGRRGRCRRRVRPYPRRAASLPQARIERSEPTDAASKSST